MRLYVIRHGKAEGGSATGLDRDRRLRDKGERQAEYLAQRLRDADVPPERIVTSSFVRAFETARPIAVALDLDLVGDERLEVGEAVSPVLDLIEEHAAEGLAIVGHNPQLEILVSALVRGLAAGAFRVRTGEGYVIDLDGDIEVGAGVLVDAWRM